MRLDRGVLPGSSKASGVASCLQRRRSRREVGRQISFVVQVASRGKLFLHELARASNFGKNRRVSGAAEYAQEVSDSVARNSPFSEGSGTVSPKSTHVDYLDGHFHDQLGSFSVSSSDGERSMVSRGVQAPYKLSGVASNRESNCGTGFKAGFRVFCHRQSSYSSSH